MADHDKCRILPGIPTAPTCPEECSALFRSVNETLAEILEAIRGSDLAKTGGMVGHQEATDSRIASIEKTFRDYDPAELDRRLARLESILAAMSKLSSIGGKIALVGMIPLVGFLIVCGKFFIKIWEHVR